MKKITIILAGLCLAAGLQAQNLDPTVEVSRAYEGKLMEVRKPVIEMCVPDTLYKFDLGFDYSVFENPYRGSYEFSPYMMDMRPESNLQKPSQFYMRAGAGYTLHPVFDLLWSPDFKGAFSMDVYGMHKSYIGAYRPVMGVDGYDGYDLLSKAGVDLGYDWNKTALDFGASYYGVAVKDFAQQRAYNAVDAYCSIGSKKPWTEGFLYNVGVGYRFSDDASALPLRGHELKLDATFGPSFGDGNRVFFDLGTDRIQRGEVERICFVVGECSVKFVIHGNDIKEIGDTCDFVKPHGVGVIDDDFEFAVHLGERTEECGIFRFDVVSGHRAGFVGFLPGFFFHDLLDIHDAGRTGDRHSIGDTELETIPFAGVVTGGDHHAAVRLERTIGEVTLGSGAETEINHISPLSHHTFGEALKKRFGVRTHIAADDDFFRSGKLDIGTADSLCHFGVDFIRVDTADIISFENSGHNYFSLNRIFLVYCIK